jgi:hypothetical protein
MRTLRLWFGLIAGKRGYMSLWNDIQPWIDIDSGLMTAPDGGKDNLILMSTYLYRELLRLGEEEAAIELSARAVGFLNKCRVDKGLYRRAPGDLSDNSVDNMIGACSFGVGVAEFIRQRWNTHFSCFDVNAPDKFEIGSNFYGRFIGLKAYIVSCSSRKPWLIQRWFWILSTLFSIKYSTGASDPLLQLLQCDAMSRRCPKTVAYWHKHYSVKSLYSQYFGEDFPLTKYAQD